MKWTKRSRPPAGKLQPVNNPPFAYQLRVAYSQPSEIYAALVSRTRAATPFKVEHFNCDSAAQSDARTKGAEISDGEIPAAENDHHVAV